jgi:hypothetical protein
VDYEHYNDASVELALDLVNDYASAPREADGTQDQPLPDLRAFLETRHVTGSDEVRPRDDVAAQRLADRLHAVFAADDPAEAAAVINAVLADHGATPQITRHDEDDWHLHYDASDAGTIDRLAVIAAMGLATVVCASGTDRLGRCAASACDDVYVDTSRNNRRRFCAESCANRSHVAAHRARQRSN